MKRFTLLVALLISFAAFSQKPDWGRMLESDSRYYNPIIVGEDDRSIYVVDELNHKMFSGNKLVLEQYDKKRMMRKYSREIEIQKRGKKRYDIEKIVFANNQFMVFASAYDRKAKTYELKLVPFDAKRGRKQKEQEVFTAKVERRRRKGEFSVVPSQNNETFLVHFSTYYKDHDQTVDVVKLFDKDLNVILDKEYRADGRQGGQMSNVLLDDEGSVYFVQNNSIRILDANANFEEWSEPMAFDGMASNGTVESVYLSFNSEQDLVVVGNYITTDLEKSDENKRRRDRKKNDTQVEGVAYLRLNTFSKEVEDVRLNHFDEDFISQFRNHRDIRKGRDSEMNDVYKSARFFFTEDGGAIFVGEHQRVITYTDRNNNTTGQDYEYNDLVCYNFTPEGELVWAQRVPKEQTFYWRKGFLGFNWTSGGPTFLKIPYNYRSHFSYMAGIDEDKFYLVYNDHSKNVKLTNIHAKTKTHRKMKKSVPVVYSLDLETGSRDKKMDLSLVSTNAYLMPGVSYQNKQDDPVYIFSQRKKDYRFGKLEFGNNGRKRARR